MLTFASPDTAGLPSGHEPTLVLLSVIVAVLASFTALQVAGRVADTEGRIRYAWLAAAAVVMGGGIWAMHFVAMMAYILPVTMSYDLGATLGSLGVAVTVTGVGLWLNSRSGAGVSTLVASGLLMGLGIAAMHYTGMAAMRFDGEILYRPWSFAGSIAIAIAAATAALKLAARARNGWRNMAAAPVMGSAIAGLHYTAMAGTVCVASPDAVPKPMEATPQTELGVVVAAGAAVILAIGLFTANVDRRLAGAAAREAEARKMNERRLQALLENASDIVLQIDDADRIGFAVLPPGALAAPDVVGARVETLTMEEDRPALQALLDTLRDTGRHAPLDVRVACAEGGRRDWSVTANDLRADPAVRGIVLTLHDVTERKRVAREAEQARILAYQASRAKSHFIASMSHELRTPLNAIIGFADLMAAEQFGPLPAERYREYANDIRESGQHLLGIVNDILDTSKIEAGELSVVDERIDVAALIEESLNLVHGDTVKRAMTIARHGDGLDATIRGDAKRLRQILINLLANAIKFSPQGGRIEVTAYLESGGGLAVAVADHGEGIPAEALTRIREPFVQADNSINRRHEGSGLGLAIAFGLADLHDGAITLESTEGEGTTATLRLPADRVASPSPRASA